MSKKYSCRSGGEECFLLDIPFNRTSRPSELTREQDGLHAKSVHIWEKPTSGPRGSQRVTFRFARHPLRGPLVYKRDLSPAIRRIRILRI
jgi:hypothetical protein